MNISELLTTLGESLGYPAFWIGLLLVGLFAHNRFAQSKVMAGIDDPQVEPRSFTTRFRYFLSAFAYIAYFEFFYGLLVGIGSLPVLQQILTQWIGSLQIPPDAAAGEASAANEIGTPAWAVLFVTAVLPSAPGFDRFDGKVLRFLHHFASIPHKARGLANEILDHLSPEFLFLDRDEAELDTGTDAGKYRLARFKIKQLGWLFSAMSILQNAARNRDNADDYERFFRGEYQAVLKDANEQFSRLRESLVASQPPSSAVDHQIDRLLNLCLLILSCALLQSEPSERMVRDKIRNTLGLAGLPRLPFDFNATQIVLNFLLVVAITFACSLVTLGFALPQGWQDLFANEFQIVGLVAYWLIPIALTMATPFVFAAGVQLYFLDRAQRTGKSAPLDARLVAGFCLFALTFSVGVVPTLLGMVAGNYVLSPNWILQVVPSGITPAVVALLFYFLSARHLLASRWQAAILDAALFAGLAAGSTYLVVKVASYAGLDFSAMTNIAVLTPDLVLLVSVTTHAVMVGIVGAVQCWISRSTLNQPKRVTQIASGPRWNLQLPASNRLASDEPT